MSRLPRAALLASVWSGGLVANDGLANEPTAKPLGTPTPAIVKPAAAPKPDDSKPAASTTPQSKAPDSTPAEPKTGDGKDPAPGHSYHGESFNQGPRQAARLMGSTGKVALTVTTKTPAAQAFFAQGLGQIHGFWYFEAERSFRQAAALDHDCAMAYWGMALANINNETRAKAFMTEAQQRKGKVSGREQRIIDALHAYYHADPKKPKKERAEKYIRDLEKILYDFPDEIELRALLAHAIWHARDAGVPITSFLMLDALLSEVFAAEPAHPAHHYRIHLWDKERSQKALASAAQCGQAAPAIAHMWHMSGHIYSDLDRFADAIWQQEAAARVDHAYMIRDSILPDQIHNYAHNSEWLIRNCDHTGRVRHGLTLAENLLAMPRHPQWNHFGKRNSTASYGQLRLFELLERYELWADLERYAQPPFTDRPGDRKERWDVSRRLGLAALHQRQADKAQPLLAELERDQRVLKREVDDLRNLVEPEQAPPSALAPANGAAAPVSAAEYVNHPDRTPAKLKEQLGKLEAELKKVTRILAELRGVEHFVAGRFADAQRELKQADTASVDSYFVARVQFYSGDREGGLKRLRDVVSSRKELVRPRAHLIALLWDADKRDEARTQFETLRKSAGAADLNVPMMTRLAPIAAALGYPADWRTPAAPANDVGVRPDLDTLGPYTWAPPTAPSWTAEDATGAIRMSQEFSGRPMLYLFYLGAGCLHCSEQLQKFATRSTDWEKLGVTVVGVSTDDRDKLTASLKNYQPEQYPYLLVADPSKAAFKTWRCFDDFESVPLHGTFLVDGTGRLRWWDLGHEPFMDVDFLLKETGRLLTLP